MKKYYVQFWYSTDLRCDATVEARTEVSALIKAMEIHNITDWCDQPKFKTTIECA